MVLFAEVGPTDVYARQTWVMWAVFSVAALQCFKVYLHRRSDARTEGLRADVRAVLDEVRAVLAVASASRGVVKSQVKDVRATLEEVKQTAAAMGAAATEAAGQPPSGSFKTEQPEG